jgi:hypothetical protein
MKMNKMKHADVNFEDVWLAFTEDIQKKLWSDSVIKQGPVSFKATIKSIDSSSIVLEIARLNRLNLLNLTRVNDKNLIIALNKEGYERIFTLSKIDPLNANLDLLKFNLLGEQPLRQQGVFNINDNVSVELLELANGSDAVNSQIRITYQADQAESELIESAILEEENVSGIDSLMRDVNHPTDLFEVPLDGNRDGIVSFSEVAAYADHINRAVQEDDDEIKVTDVAGAIIDGCWGVSGASYCAPTLAYWSETAIIPNVDVDVGMLVLEPWEMSIPLFPFFVDIPETLFESQALTYNHNGNIGILDSTLTSTSDKLETIMEDIFIQKKVIRFMSGIKDKLEFNQLLEELNAGDLPPLLVRCCVKMFDPVTGDRWPEYEVCGVRKIRKRPTIRGSNVKGGVKGKGKCCEKYYRLECKKAYDSTRTGEFQGRMHFECQYMNIIDVVNAVGDRRGWNVL